jgi:serine/threonine-protein kinase
MIGKKISNYHINECIGQGGMGTVYKATDLSLKRTVAIKMLNPMMVNNSDSFKRFENEALLSAQISHPNVATLFDFIHFKNSHFIIMEFVKGKSLDEILKFQGMLPAKEAVNIAIQILEGLGAAHELGIMHRDLKPGNIMITNRGYVKLMDFGIAKLENSERITRENSVIGTLDYLSPELLKGALPSKSSDLYSVGMMLFEMLSGTSLYTADNAASLMYQIAYGNAEVKLPGHNSKLIRIIKKLVHKQASKRYQSTQSVITDLQGLYSGGKVNTQIFSKKLEARVAKLVPTYIPDFQLSFAQLPHLKKLFSIFEFDMKIMGIGFFVGLLILLFGFRSTKNYQDQKGLSIEEIQEKPIEDKQLVSNDSYVKDFSSQIIHTPVPQEIEFIEKFEDKPIAPPKAKKKSNTAKGKNKRKTNKKTKTEDSSKSKKKSVNDKKKTQDQQKANKEKDGKPVANKAEKETKKLSNRKETQRAGQQNIKKTEKILVPDMYLSVYFPESISTDRNREGQTIYLNINKAIYQAEKLIVANGASVRATIKKLRKPEGRKKAFMAIEFDAVQAVNGKWLEVSYPEYSDISKTAVTFKAGTQLNKIKLKSTIIKL